VPGRDEPGRDEPGRDEPGGDEPGGDARVSDVPGGGEPVSDSSPRTWPARRAAGGARVAAVDCGTNSLRLLIADVDPRHGTLADVVRRMEIVRLGQGVDATGRLAPEALARTFRVLQEYATIITDSAVGAVRMVATSATRDAVNATEFIRGVTRVLGVPPEVLSGGQEAFLSFTGATAEFVRAGSGGERFAPPYLVVDIGGGSTEFVLGRDQAGGAGPDHAGPDHAGPDHAGPDHAGPDHSGPDRSGPDRAGPADAQAAGPVAATSVDIGCVRMTERHLHSDPPTATQIAAAVADIDAAIDRAAAEVPAQRARTLVGLAGSVTTVAGVALDLPGYDASRIHHARIPAGQVHEVTRMLLGQTHAQRAQIGVMHPGRIDVIGAGALVLDRILARLGFAEVVVSEHDILDGIAWSMVDHRAG
jgi:exopolyphosphatase/guanosine-5'-triphosphate,3'-diphosphate pyrophosphatase